MEEKEKTIEKLKENFELLNNANETLKNMKKIEEVLEGEE